MPPPQRACPIRSIASGFFAHISLVIDGLIRCDDDGALPAVRISDDNTKQPNFYLDRRGDDLYGYFFEPCTRRTRGGTRRTHWPMWPTWC